MPQSSPLYIALASLLQRERTLMERPQFVEATREMLNHIDSEITRLEKEHLPSGSGFDGGTEVLRLECTDSKIRFQTAFHHMDDAGGYDGWTHHKVTVRPSFTGFDITVTGPDKNEIRDYIAETFYDALAGTAEYRGIPSKTA